MACVWKLNQAAPAGGRRRHRALLQRHLGKSPAPPEITRRHTAHAGEKRGTKTGERTGREVAITVIS